MSKLFSFALLFLIGCAPTQKTVIVEEVPTPVVITRGTDLKVTWSCQLTEVNETLVWVPCSFYNERNEASSACVKVSFYDNLTGKPVVESRRVCSGPLAPHEFKTNYAAFIKEKREALQRCGELLDLCVMLASPEK